MGSTKTTKPGTDPDQELLDAADDAARARDPIAAQGAPKVRRTKGLLAATMNAKTSTSAVVVRGMPKRKITFVVAAIACAPEIFAEDFELTMESLSSEIELLAIRKAKGDTTAVGMWFAYYGMSAVNGDAINDAEAEREWLWEALGPARQIVIGMFARACSVDADSQGKALSSLRID